MNFTNKGIKRGGVGLGSDGSRLDPGNDFFTNGSVYDSLSRGAKWLLRSWSSCGKHGSASFYSRIYHPFKGWDYPYPETTGYIIPTLLRYGVQYAPEYITVAEDLAGWLIGLQDQCGLFQAGVYRGVSGKPSVFNTAQIIFGLVAYYQHSNNLFYLEAAHKAAKWLAQVQEPDGSWLSYAYHRNFSPSYYTRVAWPMLLVWRHTGDKTVYQKACKALTLIGERRNENGTVTGWGFRPDKPAFTHTIAYTIEGFLESALLLKEQGGDFWRFGEQAALELLRRYEVRGRLAGAYDEQWTGDFRFRCLTGNCQIALCWLRLYGISGDVRLLNAAIKMVHEVSRRQFRRRGSPNDGGIPGSWPVWGPYLTLRYPNWAVKFYMDLLMAVDEELKRLKTASR